MTRSGFTLLEVLVAMTIMALVVLAVFRLNAQTIFVHHDARFKALAPFLAQSKIEALARQSLSDISGDNGDFGDRWPGYTWRLEVEDVFVEPLGEVTKNLKRIDVTITLNNEYTYHLSAHRFFAQ
jgi:general secretion pathway protein I